RRAGCAGGSGGSYEGSFGGGVGGALEGQGREPLGIAQGARQQTFGGSGLGGAGPDDHRRALVEQTVEALDEQVVDGGGVGEVLELFDAEPGPVGAGVPDAAQACGDIGAGTSPVRAGLARPEVGGGEAVVDGEPPGAGLEPAGDESQEALAGGVVGGADH